MKKLGKIKLQNAVVLEDTEMKTIHGGSGGSGNCSLHCIDGTVHSVTSCSSSNACEGHGGKQNCNGAGGSSCLN